MISTSKQSNETDIKPILLNKKQRRLGNDLYDLYINIIKDAEKLKKYYGLSDNSFQDDNSSRDNLFCYLALRKRNIEEIQQRLTEDGLSSLGTLEGYVLSSLEQILKHFGYSANSNTSLEKIGLKDSKNLISNRSKSLLGIPRDGRLTSIMVTIDIDLANQPQLLEKLLKNGMDIARINCAFGSVKEWKIIIKAIRDSEKRLSEKGEYNGRCRVFMDLAGPKIRIEKICLPVDPIQIHVPKDSFGKSVRLIEGFLDSQAKYTEKMNLPGTSNFIVSISNGKEEFDDLEIGERLFFYDSSCRFHTMTVLEKISQSRIRVGVGDTIYLDEGIALQREKYFKDFQKIECERNQSGFSHITGIRNAIQTGPIRPNTSELEVKAGDRILLINKQTFKDNSVLLGNAIPRISCSIPEIFSKIEPGHRIFIDDGKIGARVLSVKNDYLELEILYPSHTPGKIKSNKGLNFPDSNLEISAITPQDIENLKFIVKNAAAVSISFTHSPDEIKTLYEEVQRLGYPNFGIIAKIETRNGVHNLGRILSAGLTLPKFGVLIARGDLAIETGFEKLSLIQEDILCLCEASHIPVILATQILETLAESGLPTRAEITDAARAQRAECVMLHKGKFIIEAIKILSLLLKTEQIHHSKKRQIFREFTWQYGMFDVNDNSDKNHTHNSDEIKI